MDIFKTLILIKNNQAKEFEDKTVDISSISTNRSIIAVTYISTSRAEYYIRFGEVFYDYYMDRRH